MRRRIFNSLHGAKSRFFAALRMTMLKVGFVLSQQSHYMWFVLFAASAVVFIATSASARVIKIPAHFASIQAGINNSANGDTVLVSQGTYFENINFRGKRIVLASRYLADKNSDIIRTTVIDGSRPIHPDSASVVLFKSKEDSTTILYGFTLVNGVGTLVPGAFLGGGILVTGGSSPQIKYNIVRSNSAIVGGGIAVRLAEPKIVHNAFAFNSAEIGAGAAIENSQAVVLHNVFHGNSADVQGGAILIKSSYVDFFNNAVTNNAAITGGGMYCDTGFWSIEYCVFYGNQNGNFAGCGDARLGDNSRQRNFNLDSADIYNNIYLNPHYAAPASFDFSLLCTSRLIDAGAEIPEGYPIGGGKEDIGMFEYPYRTADLTGDNRINLADATVLVNIVFSDTPVPCPSYAADCDCNRRVSISDVIALINYWLGIAQTSCLFK